MSRAPTRAGAERGQSFLFRKLWFRAAGAGCAGW